MLGSRSKITGTFYCGLRGTYSSAASSQSAAALLLSGETGISPGYLRIKVPLISSQLLKHAIQAGLSALGLFFLTGNLFAGGEYKPDFFRGVIAGQKFRCEAGADYLVNYYLGGGIESVKTPFKNIHAEVAGTLTVIQVEEAQPAGMELKIEKFACLENGVKYHPSLDGKTVIIRRDGKGKTFFAFKDSEDAVAAKDASMLGMIFDLGTIEPAGKTLWGYPGTIHAGNSWMPDLEIFRGQLQRLNFRTEKLEGRAVLKELSDFRGISCLLVDMNINCLLAGGETCTVTCNAAFPADNTIYGPVKNELIILRKRQAKLPETEPLAAGQTMYSEEKFHLESVMLPLTSEK